MAKSSIYYFISDVLRCHPGELGSSFIYASNHHLISKEVIREIIKDEVKKNKPEYKILINALIIQENFLRALSRASVYEVIEIVDELKVCFTSKYKNVRKKSSEVILHLFALLYFEYVIMPGRKDEGKSYLANFMRVFSKQDMVEVINLYGVLYRWILERHGLDVGVGDEEPKKLIVILEKFYSFPV